ncbi:MAG: hypothetical protein R3F56_04415 [Planctomycetota bacterium]
MDEEKEEEIVWPWQLRAQRRCWQRLRRDASFRETVGLMALSMFVVSEWFWGVPVSATIDLLGRAVQLVGK